MRAQADRLRALALLALVAALGTSAFAQTDFFGRVVSGADGAPVAAVKVAAELRGVNRDAGTTDAEGRFRIDPSSLFGVQRRIGEPFMLFFSKSGFLTVSRQLQIGATPTEIRATLTPESEAVLEPAERERLDRLVRGGARGPLFLVPYDLPAEAANLSAAASTERLRANLERAIVTHVQSNSLISTGGAVGLSLLPLDAVKDVARLKSYGAHLKALAVITGFGALEDSGGRKQIVMSSTYVVVPTIASIDSFVIYVDDTLPADQLASPRLQERLSKLWGRTTVLALGMNEFRDARAAGDQARLRRVREYLRAERAGAGPGNDQFVTQLNRLIALLDREIRP